MADATITKFQKVAQELIDNAIGFAAESNKNSPFWVIQITQSLNNEQLKIIVSHGGDLRPDGVVFILGREED